MNLSCEIWQPTFYQPRGTNNGHTNATVTGGNAHPLRKYLQSDKKPAAGRRKTSKRSQPRSRPKTAGIQADNDGNTADTVKPVRYSGDEVDEESGSDSESKL